MTWTLHVHTSPAELVVIGLMLVLLNLSIWLPAHGRHPTTGQVVFNTVVYCGMILLLLSS